MKTLAILKCALPCVLALACAGQVRAHDWLAECRIRFDNEFALTWVYLNARGTFAAHTGVYPSGDAEVCNASHAACSTYRERCGSRGYVNVEEAPTGRHGHIHLMFEDSTLTCFADPDGLGAGYGRGRSRPAPPPTGNGNHASPPATTKAISSRYGSKTASRARRASSTSPRSAFADRQRPKSGSRRKTAPGGTGLRSARGAGTCRPTPLTSGPCM